MRMRFLLRPAAAAFLSCTLLLAAHPLAGAAALPLQPLPLHARSAVMLEESTGTVLFGLNPDLPIPPASLTKLMTLHLALREIEAGRIELDQWIVPGPDTWASAMPPHSSLMFLGPGQRLTVRRLLEGLVVVSGNDAAVAVAELVAGSVPLFVSEMNSEARRLGFSQMHFEDPAGLSPASRITAREYAEFCRVFIDMHPDALPDLFSLRQFTYPLPEDLGAGIRQAPIMQANRNTLLGRYPGMDGLKTGFIDESGYNMAATALREGMRLISVVLGVPDGPGGVSGERLREDDIAALLDFGFGAFVRVTLSYSLPRQVTVWKGQVRSILPVFAQPPVVVVRKDQAARVTATLDEAEDILAPIPAGRQVGTLSASLDGTVIARFPLRVQRGVSPAGLLGRAADTVVLFFRGLAGRRPPV
jgi:serine-type D-Ala-D-Ala carboxypeptidase (penicillin-binding protein 5/6)